MNEQTKIKKTFLCLLLCCAISSLNWAGISFTEYLAHQPLKNQIKACPVVLDLKIISIQNTKTTRSSGYLKYDDYGPYIKTKEQKILVRCQVLSVQKNSSKTKINNRQTITLTFWRQIAGPLSRNYRNGWQKPPTKKTKIKALFMRGAFKKNYFLPTIIYKM